MWQTLVQLPGAELNWHFLLAGTPHQQANDLFLSLVLPRVPWLTQVGQPAGYGVGLLTCASCRTFYILCHTAGYG